MNYTFDRHDPAPDRIVLALILDMKRKKERILIGSENRIESHLHGSEEDDIYYDRIAPLGNLLMNFHQVILFRLIIHYIRIVMAKSHTADF